MALTNESRLRSSTAANSRRSTQCQLCECIQYVARRKDAGRLVLAWACNGWWVSIPARCSCRRPSVRRSDGCIVSDCVVAFCAVIVIIWHLRVCGTAVVESEVGGATPKVSPTGNTSDCANTRTRTARIARTCRVVRDVSCVRRRARQINCSVTRTDSRPIFFLPLGRFHENVLLLRRQRRASCASWVRVGSNPMVEECFRMGASWVRVDAHSRCFLFESLDNFPESRISK